MRPFLVLGLLLAVSASAQAATRHYAGHHVFISPRVASSFNAVPSWAYEPPGPAIRYNGAPSYNDPSKYGGDAALPVQ